MSNVLLIVPHFWDPICVPLGVSSLKAYAEMEKLGIPNPYSMTDIFKAEERFSGLNSGRNSGWDPLSSMRKNLSRKTI